IARTGYTGEDGFEVYVPWNQGPVVWDALLKAGSEFGIKPCGLGARDTLRLEVRFPLYGNELDSETNPLEAGLGWVTKLAKPEFVGKTAIESAKAAGIKKRLVGIRTLGAGIPRHGYSVLHPETGEKIGVVTSGTQAPSVAAPIGLAYVPNGFEKIGTSITIEIRNQKVPAEVIATPFYKRDY
ncbi:MAG: glycine cleavage system aminomethyltransferase GcvT, partial [Proteobacteria bacterium]